MQCKRGASVRDQVKAVVGEEKKKNRGITRAKYDYLCCTHSGWRFYSVNDFPSQDVIFLGGIINLTNKWESFK